MGILGLHAFEVDVVPGEFNGHGLYSRLTPLRGDRSQIQRLPTGQAEMQRSHAGIIPQTKD